MIWDNILHGPCDICGKKRRLLETSYVFPISCECHGSSHIVTVNHCRECKPIPPEKITVILKTDTLMSMAFGIISTAMRVKDGDNSYYKMWETELAHCIMGCIDSPDLNEKITPELAYAIANRYLHIIFQMPFIKKPKEEDRDCRICGAHGVFTLIAKGDLGIYGHCTACGFSGTIPNNPGIRPIPLEEIAQERIPGNPYLTRKFNLADEEDKK